MIDNIPEDSLIASTNNGERSVRINYPKLVPYSLEAKYPHLEGLFEKSPLANIFTLLRSDPFNPEEAYRLINEAPHVFLSQESDTTPAAFKDFIARKFEEFGINYFDVASEVDQAMIESVHELEIPLEAQSRIVDALSQGNISFVMEGGSHAVNVETVIDLSSVLTDALLLAHLLNTPLSHGLLKTILVAHIAHERGHTIDFSGNALSNSRSKPISTYIPVHDSDFPVEIIAGNTENMWKERFAMYFQHDAVRKLGLSEEAVEDLLRMKVSWSIYFFDTVSPSRLAAFKKTILSHPAEDEDAFMTQLLMNNMIDDMLSCHSLAQSFPFSKETIGAAIAAREVDEKQREETPPNFKLTFIDH